MDWEALWQHLEQEGHDKQTIARVVDLTYAYRQQGVQTKDINLEADNPWIAVIDELIGEPLRQWKELVKEIRQEKALVMIMCDEEDMTSELDNQLGGLQAKVSGLQHHMNNLEGGLEGLSDYIDGVEQMMGAA